MFTLRFRREYSLGYTVNTPSMMMKLVGRGLSDKPGSTHTWQLGEIEMVN